MALLKIKDTDGTWQAQGNVGVFGGPSMWTKVANYTLGEGSDGFSFSTDAEGNMLEGRGFTEVLFYAYGLNYVEGTSYNYCVFTINDKGIVVGQNMGVYSSTSSTHHVHCNIIDENVLDVYCRCHVTSAISAPSSGTVVINELGSEIKTIGLTALGGVIFKSGAEILIYVR